MTIGSIPYLGEIGKVIARTYYDAAKSAPDPYDARSTLRDGFQAIDEHSQTTQREKTFAKLGLKIDSYVYLGDSSPLKANFAIMNAIVQGIVGPMGPAIAKATYEAAQAAESSEDARWILYCGFDAIRSNDEATDEEKNLANRGIEIGASDCANREGAALAEYAVMNAIANPDPSS